MPASDCFQSFWLACFEDSSSAAYSVGSLFFLLVTLLSSIDTSEVDNSFENYAMCNGQVKSDCKCPIFLRYSMVDGHFSV